MIILDGKKLSEKILENLRNEIEQKQLKLKLAIILVGKNKVSEIFVRGKYEACKKVGIDFKLCSFSENIEEEKLKEKITELATDSEISGIVVQLPLPKNFNTQEILNLIPLKKDVDVLSGVAFEKFERNQLPILPPVVGAIKYFLEEYKISLANKKIVLVGKGKLVGKPLAIWLKNQGLDFSVVDRSVPDIKAITKEADIIISGAGVPGIIKEDMIKEGVILIDAGTSLEQGIIKGDIDKLAYKKASFVAPVPGGVGPVTVACLLENLIKINF